MTTHPITVRLFAQLRELSGIETLDYPVPADGLPLSALLTALGEQSEFATVFDDVQVMAAVNQIMVRDTHQVMPGDEVALFPPVTGG